MADHKHIVPFILAAEGGYVNNKLDQGGETNKGITYTTWKKVFGDTHDRFMKMAQEDWAFIFQKFYWDAILGDKINSQRIADVIVDWVWGSGKYYPEKHIQEILNHSFRQHIAEDGNFGPATINSINIANEQQEYDAIIKRRYEFLDAIVQKNPSQIVFLKGWKNRMQNLINFEIKGHL